MTKLDVQFMEDWLFWVLCAVVVLIVILGVFKVRKQAKKVDD